MSGFVLDASTTLAWCFEDEASVFAADSILERLNSEPAFVPALWRLEIGNVLVLAERKKRISYPKIIDFIKSIHKLDIRVDKEVNTEAFYKIINLAYHEKITTYDATYLEFAIRLKLPIATQDCQLKKAAIKFGIKTL